MNAANQCLTVYNQAKSRITAKRGSVTDEVVVALWELSQQQDQIISAQEYKLSILEAKDSGDMAIMPELSEIMNKSRKTVH